MGYGTGVRAGCPTGGTGEDAGEGDGEKAVLKADGAYMLFYMRRDVRLGES